MIGALALLLMQAAAPIPAPAPPSAPPSAPAAAVHAAPPLRPLDVAVAIEAFGATCWAHFREPDDLRGAIPSVSIPLAETPPNGRTQTWRGEDAVLSYTAADDLPATIPSRQCGLRTRLAGPADQLALAARIAKAFALPGGTTRTGPTGAQTSWDVRQPDGRIARLIVSTTNAAGGATDLRQLVLLLSPK